MLKAFVVSAPCISITMRSHNVQVSIESEAQNVGRQANCCWGPGRRR